MFEFLKQDYANLFSLLNIFVLISTLVVLFRYAYDTNIIAKQAKEANLRPVILRDGYVVDWNDVKSRIIKIIPEEKIIVEENSTRKANRIESLKFLILKNIATDISGFVIVDGYKYILLFGHEMSLNKSDGKITGIYLQPLWGWMNPNKIIAAFLDDKSKVESEEDNQIVINYKDIEGTAYYTTENKYFSSKSYLEKAKNKLCGHWWSLFA